MAFVGHKLRENFGPALSESFLPKTFLIIFFISKALIFLYLKVSLIKYTKLSFIKQITVLKIAQLWAFFLSGGLVPEIKTFGKCIKVSKSLNTREGREPISTNMINKKW